MAIRSLDGVEPIAVPIRSARLTELEADGFATVPDLHSAALNGACAAIIATDTARHAEDVLSALKEGLDVLVEKPMAVDSAEARRLCKQASELGRRIHVGCVLRFSESLDTFRSKVGDVGRLHSVHIECQSYLPDWRPHRPYQDSYSARAGEGGVLRDLIHEIDYAGWLFGWPAAVEARIKNLERLGIAAEEIAELNWETSTGCLVSVSLDYLSRPPCRRMRACGAAGTVEWDGIAWTTTAMVEGEPCRKIGASQTRDEMFLAQDRAFINTIVGNPDRRLATGEEGVKALAVCDAARRASDNRREEIVEYP
jgi:predicted dehydrogenase